MTTIYIDRCVVRHELEPRGTLYQVRWYKYSSNNDSFRPHSTIFEHFIISY